MATPPTYPTRQQLDDLDDLLQRMLSLPVGMPEGTEGPTGGGPPFVPPLETPGDIAFPPPEPMAPPPGNLILADPIYAPLPTPARPARSEPVPLPVLNPVPQEKQTGPKLLLPATAEPAPVLPPHPVSRRRSRPYEASVLLWPILWMNRSYDRCAFALGRPGRWLRRPRGRGVLGTVGLILLALALALVALERIGWPP